MRHSLRWFVSVAVLVALVTGVFVGLYFLRFTLEGGLWPLKGGRSVRVIAFIAVFCGWAAVVTALLAGLIALVAWCVRGLARG